MTVQDIPTLCEYYKDDLPAEISLDMELDMWSHTWSDHELSDELCTPEKVLPHTDGDYFPNICTLLLNIVTLPVTICESERSISLLKLLKSRLRQNMSDERLNALALMQCHKDIPIKPEEVLTIFAGTHPRRLELL